jgi:hypothetical protein
MERPEAWDCLLYLNAQGIHCFRCSFAHFQAREGKSEDEVPLWRVSC